MKYSWLTILLVSGVEQGDSVFYIYAYVCVYVCICMYIYMYVYSFQDSFPYRLLQDVEYSSLRYTVVPNSFFIFYFGHGACGILVIWPGFEPPHPALELWHLNRCTTREVPQLSTQNFSFFSIWIFLKYCFFSPVLLRCNWHLIHSCIRV